MVGIVAVTDFTHSARPVTLSAHFTVKEVCVAELSVTGVIVMGGDGGGGGDGGVGDGQQTVRPQSQWSHHVRAWPQQKAAS